MLTTLKRLKVYLGLVDSYEDDDILNLLLAAVSAQVESYCNRVFAVTSYTETLVAREGYALASNYPITAVTTPAGSTFDGARIVGDFTDGTEYAVAYSAGYATIPADLELAVMVMVAQQYYRRGSEHVKLEVTGPLRSEFIEGMPEQVKNILQLYRRPVV